jgi:recombination protein RecT
VLSTELQTTVVEKPLLALLGKYKGQIEQILPQQFNGKRALKLIVGAINKTPKLLECTPMSVINSVLTAASMGLEIRPGQAYLVPFRNKGRMECTLVVDYRGKIDLVTRSGKVIDIDPDIVYSRDKFRIFRDETGAKVIEHEPTYFVRNDDGSMRPITEADRGVPIGALAVAAMKDGRPKVCFMPAIDIMRIKGKSRSSGDGPWVTDELEMWKKTVVHRICKLLPQTPELALAQAADDAMEMDVPMDHIIDIDPEDENAPPLLEPGSTKAAAEVGEAKVAQMQAERAARQAQKPPVEVKATPAAETKQEPVQEPQEQPQGPISVASWDELPDAIDPELGLEITVGGKKFVRESVEQTWTAAAPKQKPVFGRPR